MNDTSRFLQKIALRLSAHKPAHFLFGAKVVPTVELVTPELFSVGDQGVLFETITTIRARARVLAVSNTPDEVTGKEFAGLDLVLGTGGLATWLWKWHFGIERSISQEYINNEQGLTQRIAWHAYRRLGLGSLITHAHIVFHPPYVFSFNPGDLVDIEAYAVNIGERGEDGKPYSLLDNPCYDMGTSQCPWLLLRYVHTIEKNLDYDYTNFRMMEFEKLFPIVSAPAHVEPPNCSEVAFLDNLEEAQQ